LNECYAQNFEFDVFDAIILMMY